MMKQLNPVRLYKNGFYQQVRLIIKIVPLFCRPYSASRERAALPKNAVSC
jgi:hypothetical protein